MQEKKVIPISERRRFIRHPLCFPLTYEVVGSTSAKTAEEKKSATINISMGGILFASMKPVKSGAVIILKMPFQNKIFNVRAKVVHCDKSPETSLYNIGASFHRLSAAYKVKLIEQLYLISEFRDLRSIQLGREITLEKASKEWIKRYSARFKRLYWVVLFIIAAAAPFAYASQGLEEAMSGMRSPEDVARFFSREFTYSMTLPDRAHSPEETIEAMSGDCEDFAILASEMLTRMGIENQVLIIRFSGMKIAHAVCIWKDKNGCYSFISNQKLQRTSQRTAEGAIRKFYPDCQALVSIDPRTCARDSGSSESSNAKSYHGAGLMTNLDPRLSSNF